MKLGDILIFELDGLVIEMNFEFEGGCDVWVVSEVDLVVLNDNLGLDLLGVCIMGLVKCCVFIVQEKVLVDFWVCIKLMKLNLLVVFVVDLQDFQGVVVKSYESLWYKGESFVEVMVSLCCGVDVDMGFVYVICVLVNWVNFKGVFYVCYIWMFSDKGNGKMVVGLVFILL